MKKFFIYCHSDGIIDTLRMSIKAFISVIYSNSITDFYCFSDKHPLFINSENIKEIEREHFKTIFFPRLNLLSDKGWIEKGSKCYVKYIDNNPIAFTWTHFNSYFIHGVGTFILKENECWLGPTFVLRMYRRRGFNKEQIQFQMQKTTAEIYYTSVNHRNIPSAKSFENLGFKKIGYTHRITLFGFTIHNEISANIKSMLR